MIKQAVVALGLVWAAVTSLPAQAQTAPISRTIPVTFTGTVTSSAADTIMVRQPDGILTHYTGPLPDYPYAVGDQVTISFDATLPTKAFYDTVYAGQIAADGIYHVTVTSPYYNGGTSPGGIGNSTVADVLGPIDQTLNFGQPTNTRMTLVYDYNTDSYSIDWAQSNPFVSSAYDGPGFVYNAATGQYDLCSDANSCRGSAFADPVIFGIFATGDGSVVRTSNISINSTDTTSGTGMGLFSLAFTGAWNLPAYGGGSTPVPAPGMALLFALACGALVARRASPKLA